MTDQTLTKPTSIAQKATEAKMLNCIKHMLMGHKLKYGDWFIMNYDNQFCFVSDENEAGAIGVKQLKVSDFIDIKWKEVEILD